MNITHLVVDGLLSMTRPLMTIHLVVDGLLSMTRPAIKIVLSSKFDLIVLFSNLTVCKRVPDSTKYK